MHERSYRNWMIALRECLDRNPKAKIVLRHDADFDLHICRRMMEIERAIGLASVIYVDVHDPNYTMGDIQDLHDDFKKDGFLFGLHVNTAYDRDREDAILSFHADLRALEEAGIPVHSTAAHAYSEAVKPQPSFTNFDVVDGNDEAHGGPSKFINAFFGGQQVSKLGDGGGVLAMDPMAFIPVVARNNGSGWLSFHPVHFREDGGDLVFTKPIGRLHPPPEVICSVQESMTERITPYLAMPLDTQSHLDQAVSWLSNYLTENYRDSVSVLDGGCGIGLMGAHLMKFNNLRYAGFDVEPRWIAAGGEFLGQCGYSPAMFVADIFRDPLPSADILAFLGSEDGSFDYERLYQVAGRYKNFIVSIISPSMREMDRLNGKQRVFIPEGDFERLFGRGFEIRQKSPGKRIVYWLERKG